MKKKRRALFNIQFTVPEKGHIEFHESLLKLLYKSKAMDLEHLLLQEKNGGSLEYHPKKITRLYKKRQGDYKKMLRKSK